MHTIQIDREKEREGWLLGLGQIKCIQIGNKHATGVKKKKIVVVHPQLQSVSQLGRKEQWKKCRHACYTYMHYYQYPYMDYYTFV